MKHLSHGTSLFEVVLSIMVLSILAGTFATLIVVPLQVQQGTVQRLDLSGLAAIALQHMHKHLNHAVPNTVRIRSQGNKIGVEFLHALETGRYDTGTGNSLDFSQHTDQFDVLGGLHNFAQLQTGSGSTACLNASADCLAILGTQSPYAGNLATIAAATVSTLTFDNDNGWFFDTPIDNDNRFYVIDTPMSYICDQQQNHLTFQRDYPITVTQSLNLNGQLLATQVNHCEFRLFNGVVRINLDFDLNGHDEIVTFFQQVAVGQWQ